MLGGAAIYLSSTIGQFQAVDIDQWVFEFRECDECPYGVRGKLVDGRYPIQHCGIGAIIIFDTPGVRIVGPVVCPNTPADGDQPGKPMARGRMKIRIISVAACMCSPGGVPHQKYPIGVDREITSMAADPIDGRRNNSRRFGIFEFRRKAITGIHRRPRRNAQNNAARSSRSRSCDSAYLR
jgi:hypothetical protein